MKLESAGFEVSPGFVACMELASNGFPWISLSPSGKGVRSTIESSHRTFSVIQGATQSAALVLYQTSFS